MLTLLDLRQDGVHLIGSILVSDEQDGLVDDLLARVAVHSLGGRVPARDDPVERRPDDGIVGILDDCRQPAHPVVTIVCFLAFGQVAYRRDHQRAVLGVKVGQSDVHRELGAIPVPSAQLQIESHGASPRVCEKALPVRRVDLPERLRHQCLDGLADQVIAVIVEQRFRLVIDKPDHARLVHPHHGIRNRL